MTCFSLRYARRRFGGVCGIVLLAMLAGASAFAQQYDLLIKNGHVIDPGNEIDAVLDVAIKGDSIAAVAKDIPSDQAKKTIDATGLYVTPGLIDLHAHVFGYSGWLWPDDTQLLTGTTTVVDCGGSGWRTFETFKETVIDRSKTRVLAFINVVGAGMVGTESDIDDMDAEKLAAKIKQFPEIIVGIKCAHYGRKDYYNLEQAVKAGNLAGVPMIVDNSILTSNDRDTETKLLKYFRPGDIHTHMFNDRHLEIADRFTGKIQPYMLEARKKGRLLDVGHGSGSFVWPNAHKVMAQHFYPDTISTDLHNSSIFTTKADMPNVMSKMMALGMSLQETIFRSTARPAQVIRKYPEIGTLGTGKIADIAVLELEEGIFGFADSWKKKKLAKQRLRAVLTVRAGELVFDEKGLGFPEWQTAGEYEKIP
ncbi:MAG: amidohydrolase/deacetylase family metallohydrolase [Acidobacteria bacterium]|nr:amidohydrolase/deacetylase family metallohydrolase [Acidobacteriota bacterium]